MERGTQYGHCQSAQSAVAAMRAGWNLANTFESCGSLAKDAITPRDFETAWRNPVTTPGMFDAVKAAGFGAVRLPVTWGLHTDNAGVVSPEWLDRIEEVAGYVLDRGMYCIINVHHDTGEHGWLRAAGQPGDEMHVRFASLWRQIAERFAGYGERLFFESYNELLDADNHWKTPDAAALSCANGLNQLFVDVVRDSGGYNTTRNLVVNTYAGASHRNLLRGFVLPTDRLPDHLVVEAHSYDPWGFTISTAVWDEEHKTEQWTRHGRSMLRATFRRLRLRFSSKGIPVIIGEYGSEDKNNTPERVKWARFLVSEAAKSGIVCFYWDTNEMHLLDRKREVFDFPELVAAVTGSGE